MRLYIASSALSLLSLVLCLSILMAGVHSAHAQAPDSRGIGSSAGGGSFVSLNAGLVVPAQGGRLRASSVGELGYQFSLAPVALSVSARVASFLPSDDAFAAALASLRVMWPLPLASPFVLAAIGPGYLSSLDRLSVTYQVGAGALVDITRNAALGLEATYTQLDAGSARQFFLGPMVRVKLD